jgi:hypothetical protein
VAQGRKARIEAGAHYRRDFLDSDHWDDLARARGLRLPHWHRPCSAGQLGVWLRKLGVERDAYLEWAGERSLGDFAARNPDWPLRAWVGTVLEMLAAA